MNMNAKRVDKIRKVVTPLDMDSGSDRQLIFVPVDAR